jgi:glycogen(starch) synthase
MRLLLTTDTVGGVWHYTATLARALADDGHAVLLAVLGEPSASQLAQLPAELVISCRNHRLEWMTDAQPEIQPAANWLADLARGWRADVVHLNQMVYAGVVRFEAPIVVVIHSDVLSWFSEVRGVSPPPEWEWYRRSVKTGLRAASRLVAPSRYQADLVGRHYGVPVSTVIHNGVDMSATGNHSESLPPIVISAGRAWDEAKGIRFLDQALMSMGETAPPAHLLGDLQGPGSAVFTAERLMCEGSVSAAESRRWMARATIYCGPSLYEPFGLGPAEAAANGCALILSDIGSFRELWDGCAAFFRPGDSVALANLIGEMVADPTRVAGLAAVASARARDWYSAVEFANAYLATYHHLRRGTTPSARQAPSILRGA